MDKVVKSNKDLIKLDTCLFTYILNTKCGFPFYILV